MHLSSAWIPLPLSSRTALVCSWAKQCPFTWGFYSPIKHPVTAGLLVDGYERPARITWFARRSPLNQDQERRDVKRLLERKKGIVLKKKKNKRKKNPYWRIEMFIFTTDYKIERDTVLEIKADKIEGKILENNL